VPRTTSTQVKHEVVARCRTAVGCQVGSAAPVTDDYMARTDRLHRAGRGDRPSASASDTRWPTRSSAWPARVAIVFVRHDAAKEVFRLMDAVDLAAMELVVLC